MTRTTDQTAPDDPVISLIAKRKAEALARAEKEHKQLEAAAKLYAQGTKIVTDAEENLRKGQAKQDTAIATMVDNGLDNTQIAETLGLAPRAITEAVKRHRAATEGDAPAATPKAAPAARRGPKPKAGDEKAADDKPGDAANGAPAATKEPTADAKPPETAPAGAPA
jgi:hypothetical protein